MKRTFHHSFLALFAATLLLLIGCSKSTSTIRIQVYYMEAETNIKTLATNVVVKLYKEGNEVQSATTSNDGTVTFQKLEKNDNWSVTSAFLLNGISYSGSTNGIKTDGRTGVSSELILRN